HGEVAVAIVQLGQVVAGEFGVVGVHLPLWYLAKVHQNRSPWAGDGVLARGLAGFGLEAGAASAPSTTALRATLSPKTMLTVSPLSSEAPARTSEPSSRVTLAKPRCSGRSGSTEA